MVDNVPVNTLLVPYPPLPQGRGGNCTSPPPLNKARLFNIVNLIFPGKFGHTYRVVLVGGEGGEW